MELLTISPSATIYPFPSRMSLKAVLFDFNGVIIHDEPIHEKLLNQLLIEENMRPKPGEFRQVCLGRSDRACLTELFNRRGRIIHDALLDELIARKARLYAQELATLDKLPLYPGLDDFIFHLRAAKVKLAVVSGAIRSEIELVLKRAELNEFFSVIVSGDEGIPSKPEPAIYLKAIERLNQQFPDLNLKPQESLAIEDTFAGIEAAKRAGIPVVGVANSYPYHMLQRRANWTVDYISDLELDRVQQVFAGVARKVS
ncbi:HAD family hydrolase [Leptothermofonsia sichuanensis]|uniref:HAD family hydrolase n=1 Tax=Leptothermofonsia sichuanensis TaxID=2917832 RepID=UPI001EF068E6